MTTKPISNRMYSLLVLYDMHTDFFSRALDSISDKDSHNRLNTKANHIAWLTGSLVQQRAEAANYLGNDYRQQAVELFKENKGIQDDITYPSLDDFKRDWQVISPLLREAFMTLTDEKLDSNFEMPGMTIPYFDLVSFIIYREANIIGQIALWRRLLGYDAMNYM
ncbi:MAG: DinB family protein [Ferruginibacter sp.]